MDEFGYSIEVKLSDEEVARYLAHKRRWCDLQPLIESRGYRLPKEYHPDRATGWEKPPPGSLEDPHYPHLLQGTRISDNRPVMLKFSRTDLWEATIFEHLSSIPDEDNHTIPLYDVITPPAPPDSVEQWCIVVTPRLTDCRNRHIDSLRDFVNFLSQVLEGICFMHRYNIAHTDVARTNIVWDARHNMPDPSDPKGKARKKEPAQKKYYFIDFGLACSYSSFEERGLVRGVCGQHRNIPELSEDVPYDPFPLDIRQLGEMLKRDYTEVYLGLDFLYPWMSRLRDDDPTKRPTSPEALAEFQMLVSALPEEKLRARLIGRNEWPNGQRILFVVIFVWLTVNGTLLWWNWDRFQLPLTELEQQRARNTT
ncbi:hypothetical protein B0H15DRAFT_775593 [Mycena belliarum]|uniref:Protein kinase domain-containing protein n=1 Tax=Mycena belliarum TaxID=1033014 RepID=A0AAD6U9B6_9AGAR|nr:hypothetical protein B0H15DRAFT_775593 [Mycena belliae]